MSGGLTQIFYFIPEDNESIKQLNCFLVYKDASKITLSDIRTEFPVPGDYHFRFQYLYGKQNLVWLDLSNEGCALPKVDGSIVIKALRKSWVTKQHASGQHASTGQEDNFLQ